MSKIRYLTRITKIANTSSPNIKHVLISRPTDSFSYTAGQWIEVFMASKTDSSKLLCTGFSMITSDHRNGSDLEFAIKHSDCEIVEWLHNRAKVGDSITISLAQGIMTYPHHTLLDDTDNSIKAIVLISGGIGVTPHLAIFDSIYCNGDETRDVWFVHQTRLRCEHIFRERVQAMCDSRPNLNMIYVCTQNNANTTTTTTTTTSTANHIENDYSHRVSLSLLSHTYGVPVSDALFYISGPPLMVKNLEDQIIMSNINRNRCITEKW